MELAEGQEVVARRVSGPVVLDAAKPAAEWELADPIRFCADWQGRNPDPDLETEVRVLWSAEMLFLRFVCRFREIFVFDDSDPGGRRDHLWDRDVAEAFLQPPAFRLAAADNAGRRYKEFEIAPNGMWIDLDISESGLSDLKSGMSRSTFIDRASKIWVAELALPMLALTPRFDPSRPWRANFYRVEGKTEPRRYLAWRPTHTPEPNFHVPQAFGTLHFAE